MFYSNKRGKEEREEAEDEEEEVKANVQANTLALPHYGSIETNTVVVDVEIKRQSPFYRDYNDADDMVPLAMWQGWWKGFMS